MMRLGLEEQIAEAEQLTEEGRYGQADAAMRQVLIDLHGEDLENQRERLEHLVSRFPPKRRRDLGTLLNTHLISIRPSQGTPSASVPPAIPRTCASSPALEVVRVQPEQRDALRRWLRPQLQDLGNRFLFQWRPYYLRVISEIFDKLLHLEDLDAVGLSALCITLREEFAFHATAVYQKG